MTETSRRALLVLGLLGWLSLGGLQIRLWFPGPGIACRNADALLIASVHTAVGAGMWCFALTRLPYRPLLLPIACSTAIIAAYFTGAAAPACPMF